MANLPTQRINKIDFLKALMILLMVAFHLAWFSQGHPWLKSLVYTFHMPIFLVISGYFSRANTSFCATLRKLSALFIPYLIMESGYAYMCSILPISEHINTFSLSVWAYHIFIHPLGPYWYFHTLIICLLCRTIIYRIPFLSNPLTRLLLIILMLYAFHHIVVFSNALYFVAGIALYETRTNLIRFLSPTFWAALPLALLIFLLPTFNRATLSGIAITYLVASLSLAIYVLLQRLSSLRIFLFIGRNTLPILLFSPLFTLLSKNLIPLFSFDPSRLLFMLVATTLSVVGSLALARLSDICRLSPFFFLKKQVLNPF